jgi:hypothetical protein
MKDPEVRIPARGTIVFGRLTRMGAADKKGNELRMKYGIPASEGAGIFFQKRRIKWNS